MRHVYALCTIPSNRNEMIMVHLYMESDKIIVQSAKKQL